MPGRSDTPRRPRRLPAAGIAVLLAAVAAAALVLVLVLRDDTSSGRVVEVTIPAGTKARLDRGDRTAGIPRRIEGRVGDTLRIVNRDRAPHTVAGFPVAAGQALELPLRSPGVTEGMCTAHPEDRVAIVVRPACAGRTAPTRGGGGRRR
jgi:hypothetical protein